MVKVFKRDSKSRYKPENSEGFPGGGTLLERTKEFS